MKITAKDFDQVLRIEADTYTDYRGWFCEAYNKSKFREIGITIDFVQINFSFSKKAGTIRGIHYQERPYQQSKLIKCVKGNIYDVVVDLRTDSDTYLQWKSYELSDKINEWLLIPQGFGHGFQCLCDNCIVTYQVDQYYNKESDRSIKWCDPQIGIQWPIDNPILSKKDRKAPMISNFRKINL